MNMRPLIICIALSGIAPALSAETADPESASTEAATEAPAEAPNAIVDTDDTAKDDSSDAETAMTEDEIKAMEAERLAEEERAKQRAEEEKEAERLRVQRELERRYGAVIDNLEGEGGAYNPLLSEALMGMGDAYYENGLYDEAVDTLQRAAHITRVNEGLYSTSGIPILEKLIELHAARGEWEDVGARYQQMFTIQKRNARGKEEELLPAMEKLSDWHLKAYQEGIGEDPVNHLISAQSLYMSSTEIMERSDSITDEKLVETLKQTAITSYYLATHTPSEKSAAFTWEINNGGSADNPMAQQSFVIANYSAGKQALSKVVDIYGENPDVSAVDRANALAELGDWHLMFNRRSTAQEYYQEAWAVLEDARANGQTVPDNLFIKPRPLPIESESSKTTDDDYRADSEFGYIIVQFDISMTGRASDIELLEANPEDHADEALSDLSKRLRATRFRPQLNNGLAVNTENVVYKYTYPL